MSFTECPPEIIEYISGFLISDAQSLWGLVGACRYTYAALKDHLYREIECENDSIGALCCRTLANSKELATLVRSFAIYGPDHLHGEENREMIRNMATALGNMPNLVSLNCDISYCSLEVCVTLSTGNFDNLESLALRITDSSIPISRSVHRLGDLSPRLPNLRQLLIRDNTQPSHARHFIEHFIDYRRAALNDVMLSCWYDSGNQYLLTPCVPDTMQWSSLTRLTIRRDAFCLDTLSHFPSVRQVTILRDLRPMSCLPPDILPNLEHIGCATFNLGAFLPKNETGRPICSVTLDGISATGMYHGARNQPTRSSLRSALSHLAYSSKPITHLAFPVRMLYARFFSDVSPYLQEATSVIVHIVTRAEVQTGENRNATRGTSVRELGELIVRQLPCLKILRMPNAAIPCKNDPPAASEEERVHRHRMILDEWSAYRPTLERVSLGWEYMWEKKEGEWRRVDAVYERDDHELRYFDY